jgi:putative intracellular protease/amidase
VLADNAESGREHAVSRRILMLLPDLDFDPSETGVPWRLARDAGHDVVFATETGAAGKADPIVLDGVIFGLLGPSEEARRDYEEMARDAAYNTPLRWEDVDADDFDALFLPGGHAKGMCPYFESAKLHDVVGAFFRANKPVGAVCHGTLLAARSRDSATGQSVLYGRRTTCLPKYMERSAWLSTAWKMGRYFRTYDEYVEDEVLEALGPSGVYERGPIHLFAKGSSVDHGPTHVVRDGNYVSARWPGDVYAIGEVFASMVSALS